MLLKYTLLFYFLLFCTQAGAKPVAIIIHVDDGTVAVDEKDFLFTKDLLTEGLKNHRIESVNISMENRTHNISEKIANASEIKRQLEMILRADDEVTHLVISTHGSTEVNTGESTVYNLKGVGSISEHGALGTFTISTSPLIGKMSEAPHIILNSCSAFCSTPEVNESLAKSLASALGVNSAYIYGSNQETISEHFVFDPHSTNLIAKEKSIGRRLMNKLGVLTAAGATGLFVGAATLGSNAISSEIFVGGIAAVGISIGIFQIGKISKRTILNTALNEHKSEFQKSYGLGTMFILENNEIIGSDDLNRLSDTSKIYGLSTCSSIL